MPFFLKAASLAMQSYPLINSTLNMTTMEVTLKSRHNFGVAVATPFGIVPFLLVLHIIEHMICLTLLRIGGT
jgi:pyruvate/2-oxoglutarate dehydrogenase complex dihydrolipoamide acyltransferase (E2) component